MGTPVPTRPVVSGNRGVNTHLSELISEILEPVALKMGGGEIASTEEALHDINNINNMIRESNGEWDKMNVIRNIFEAKQKDINGEEDTAYVNESVGMNGMNNNPSRGVGGLPPPRKESVR